MKIIVGLTGPTGSGKSMVSEAVKRLGVKVVDCDALARVAVKKDSDGLAALKKAFGEGILLPDGTISRKSLAEAAFSSKEKTELLNKTLLPFIADLVIKESNSDKVLLDAPTLFESGLDSVCNSTVAVLSDSKIRLQRIIKRDNLTLIEAKMRMSAGKDDEYYKQKADYVIYNNNDENRFMSEADAVFKKIFGGR